MSLFSYHDCALVDANGSKRYKFRMKDVRPMGVPVSARIDESLARSAFAEIQVGWRF
jgi:hypothetical protein